MQIASILLQEPHRDLGKAYNKFYGKLDIIGPASHPKYHNTQ